MARYVRPDSLDEYERLRGFMERVEDLPGVKNYLEERPPMSELGKNAM